MNEREKFLCEMSEFWNAYDRLSEEGKCDVAGGMECRRVLGEWLVNLDESRELDEFIRERANYVPA